MKVVVKSKWRRQRIDEAKTPWVGEEGLVFNHGWRMKAWELSEGMLHPNSAVGKISDVDWPPREGRTMLAGVPFHVGDARHAIGRKYHAADSAGPLGF